VAGAVGQWYFTPVGVKLPGAALRSLKHALGPSFGSLSFASAILTILKYIRWVKVCSALGAQGKLLHENVAIQYDTSPCKKMEV
jgi:hypothetical protein